MNAVTEITDVVTAAVITDSREYPELSDPKAVLI